MSDSPPPDRKVGLHRRAAAAAILLVAGVGLLGYALLSRSGSSPNTSAGPSTASSAVLLTKPQTVAASPTPRATQAEQVVVVVITSYTQVPINQPASTQDSGLLALISTIGGLAAFVAGIVSAIVSAMARPARQR